MRAAAILGLGCSPRDLKPFQADKAANVDWRLGLPAASDHADVILLFGGDGTVHRHLSQLVRLDLPVLVVPAGSGNDFARALRLHRVQDSLTAWRRFCRARDNVRTIDLGVITPLESAARDDIPSASSLDSLPGPFYFCCVAGVGLDAEVARRANHLPRWLRAHGGYALTLAPTIFRFAPLPMKIRTPADSASSTGEQAAWTVRSDQPTILAAFANTPVYGSGMKIAPRAQMDDGKLDVCLVTAANPFKLFCLFPTVYFGRHLNIREVEYFQASRLRVETEHPLEVYADGEYVCRTPVDVVARSAALKVITPTAPPANVHSD
jgi:diacylglycerol kinase (ATP)